MIETQNKKPFYKKWWGIILAILFFYIFIPYYIWKHTTWSKGIKIFTTILCILFLIFLFSINGKQREKAQEFFQQAEQQIQQGDITQAKNTLELSKNTHNSKNNPATDLQEKITEATNQDIINSSLVNLTEEEFSQLKGGNLQKKFFENESLNIFFINTLKENSENREKLLREQAEKEQKEKEEQEQRRQEEEKKQKEEERIKKIEKQFDAWDGSHIEITKHLKKNLNDPKSYEHIETQYTDKGDHLVIFTDFRTKNAFNATIKVQAISLVDLDGNIQKVTINNNYNSIQFHNTAHIK